jgi:hypothetical protein
MVKPKIPVTRIILPAEHGSWSLLFEPLTVGLAVAYSTAAPWVVLMMVGTFMLRQPLKIRVIAHKNVQTARTAEKFLVLFALIAGVGFVGTALTSSPWAFFPFAVAAPLAVQQFILDISTRGRSLVAELAGAVAISSSVAVGSLGGGLGFPNAMALWVILVGRFIPSILYVRNKLAFEKGRVHDAVSPVVANAASVLIILGLAFLGLASFFTAAMFVFFLGRAIYGLRGERKGTRAMVVGITEVVFGVLTVASIIVGYYAGI